MISFMEFMLYATFLHRNKTQHTWSHTVGFAFVLSYVVVVVSLASSVKEWLACTTCFVKVPATYASFTWASINFRFTVWKKKWINRKKNHFSK